MQDLASTTGSGQVEDFSRVSPELLRQYWAEVSKDGAAGSASRLSEALATRLAEVVPPGVSVRSTSDGIGIRGPLGGCQMIFTAFLLLLRRLDVPGVQRGRYLLHAIAFLATDDVRKLSGEPWPSERAEPCVEVLSDGMRLYWAEPETQTRVLALRDFAFADLPEEILGV